jgi:hypothetical protein
LQGARTRITLEWMTCNVSSYQAGTTLPNSSKAAIVKAMDDPTVLREKPELKDVVERAAHGLLDLIVRTKGFGMIVLAKL